MATCVQTIDSGSVTAIGNNYAAEVSLNASANRVFSFALETSLTVYVKLTFKTSTTPLKNVSVTLLNANKDIITTTTFKETSGFQTTLQRGEYYICLRTLIGSYTLTLEMSTLIYRSDIKIPMIATSGTRSSFSLKVVKPKVKCTQPMKFEIIEGSLPPGLTFNEAGLVSGTVPVIDTLSLLKIPSANLMVPLENETLALSLQWYFTVKVSLLSNPSRFDTKRFCLQLYNNNSLSIHEHTSGEARTEYHYERETVHVHRETTLCDPGGSTPIIQTRLVDFVKAYTLPDNVDSRVLSALNTPVPYDVTALGTNSQDRAKNWASDGAINGDALKVDALAQNMIDFMGADFFKDDTADSYETVDVPFTSESDAFVVPFVAADEFDVKTYVTKNLERVWAQGVDHDLINRWMVGDATLTCELRPLDAYGQTVGDFTTDGEEQLDEQTDDAEVMDDAPLLPLDEYGNEVALDLTKVGIASQTLVLISGQYTDEVDPMFIFEKSFSDMINSLDELFLNSFEGLTSYATLSEVT